MAAVNGSQQQTKHETRAVIFILLLTVWGVEPVVNHQTSWLESTVQLTAVQLHCSYT